MKEIEKLGYLHRVAKKRDPRKQKKMFILKRRMLTYVITMITYKAEQKD